MTKNRPGRPSLDPSGGPTAAVHLKLRVAEYDRLDSLARQKRTSMQDIIRQGLRHLLHDQRGGTL
jgi:hypothetical protein